jgi:hypothetical protein
MEQLQVAKIQQEIVLIDLGHLTSQLCTFGEKNKDLLSIAKG